MSLLGSAVLATTGAGIAAAQPGGPGGGQLSQQDQPFMTQNAQTDLAEITVGAAGGAARDHRATSSGRPSHRIRSPTGAVEVAGLERTLHVTLPNSPDATQQQLEPSHHLPEDEIEQLNRHGPMPDGPHPATPQVTAMDDQSGAHRQSPADRTANNSPVTKVWPACSYRPAG